MTTYNTKHEVTPKIHQKRRKSLQDIINQTMRINGYAGNNWYWSLKREKLIKKIYSHYVNNIHKLGGFDEPNKKFTIEEYKGITTTEAKHESDRIAFAKASKAFIQEWRNNNPYPGSDRLDDFNAKFNREYSEFVEKWEKDNGTQINSYMLPNPCPIERGEYQETELDRQKKQADILLESIDGNWYTIRLNKKIDIKSKRIRNYDNGTIAIPESLFHKLESKYNVMCNF